MNLQKLSDHTVDVDLLPERPVVLDVGCRGFGFCKDILRLRPDAYVIALDPDPKIEMPDLPIHFHRVALAENSGHAWYRDLGGEANEIIDTPEPNAIEVKCVSIMGAVHAKIDLIKLDCEGSEFGILENWPYPIATQISVEFHDYKDRTRWDDAYFTALFAGPLRDYKVVQHELFGVGPGPTLGHWDSLLVLK